MKLRNDSTLSTLTDEQQAQLYDWLQTFGYTETLKKVAAPPPDGFDLKTHRATLHGFFKRYSRTIRVEEIAAAKENRSNPDDGSALVSDAEQSFLHAGHQIATGPLNPEDFAKISHWLEWHKDGQTKLQYVQIAHRQLQLAEKRHELNRDKWEFDIAREALLHVASLREILQNRSINDEEKINRARAAVFNRPVIELPPRITHDHLPERNGADSPAPANQTIQH